MAVFSGAAFSQAAAPADKAPTDSSKPSVTAPGPRAGMGPGMGAGMGPRGGMMRFDQKNTPGWSLMTPEERTAHRDRMHSFKTVDECRAYHDEHVKQMDARAKEKGQAARPFRGDPCAVMQQRGFIK
ncbi:MAG TPA: hypothetical protein VGE12_17695 [Noviherbaspirillum sp.]